jgi:hypothetical protein
VPSLVEIFPSLHLPKKIPVSNILHLIKLKIMDNVQIGNIEIPIINQIILQHHVAQHLLKMLLVQPSYTQHVFLKNFLKVIYSKFLYITLCISTNMVIIKCLQFLLIETVGLPFPWVQFLVCGLVSALVYDMVMDILPVVLCV